ncbi:MAG: alginate lyase family protein [Planctomycetaceae bacterium]|nr:alginate lyase family protein [Planctomycetaceae bacterium]
MAWYRAQLRYGWHPVQKLSAVAPTSGPFFRGDSISRTDRAGNSKWQQSGRLFGFHPVALSDEQPPNWLLNQLNQQEYPNADQPWWKLADFDNRVGDIKGVWELSRWDWVLAFAQQATQGHHQALGRLNHWLSDWCQHNPNYRGPNWKCGQEASIRVLHLVVAAHVLNETKQPTAAVRALIVAHLQRIAPTISYAVGQSNNHATSEAAALFIGGDWLRQIGESAGERWNRLGRDWLEDRAATLIEPDGTFSQYSVNYHRLMLDAYSLCLWWQSKHSLPAFSQVTVNRLKAATDWLDHLVDPDTGDVPNLGANDGANLLPLTDADYRDYRPSLALAKQLLAMKTTTAGDENTRNHLAWLGLESKTNNTTNAPRDQPATPVRRSRVFDDGGFAVLQNGNLKAVFRYPRFRFRPGHCDALHVDFWVGSQNLLRDAGSYSYNCEPDLEAYFKGPSGHNSIEFDQREPMPKLGRFLYGDWLTTRDFQPLAASPTGDSIQAAYRDRWGAAHCRKLTLGDSQLDVTDTVAGFQEQAVLRWRLAPGSWESNVVDESPTMGPVIVKGPLATITVSASVPLFSQVVEGWESRYYGHKSPLPVLEVVVTKPCQIQTTIATNS